MKTILTCAIFLFTGLFHGDGCRAADAAEEGEKFFDFDAVNEEDRKKAEEEMKNQGLAADGALPANVREVLDKLTKFQLIEVEIADHRIGKLREALKAKVKALA